MPENLSAEHRNAVLSLISSIPYTFLGSWKRSSHFQFWRKSKRPSRFHVEPSSPSPSSKWRVNPRARSAAVFALSSTSWIFRVSLFALIFSWKSMRGRWSNNRRGFITGIISMRQRRSRWRMRRRNWNGGRGSMRRGRCGAIGFLWRSSMIFWGTRIAAAKPKGSSYNAMPSWLSDYSHFNIYHPTP